MTSPKLQEVCCYQSALEWISHDFANQLPVYARGIASSRSGQVILPKFTEVGSDAVVRNIDEVLENGTELVIDVQGRLVDRPMDTIDEGILTRVSHFPGGTYMMMVRQALVNLERFAYNNLDDNDRANLVPTLLVYDASKVTFMGGVQIALPHELNARQDSLLKAYLIESVYCRREE